jgi:hypothetical protein
MGGFHIASNREDQIRAWWAEFPQADVAIALRKSGLAVLDCDHGNKDEAEFVVWVKEHDLPRTFTVRTGRRVNKDTGEPEFGTQMYYAADDLPTIGWADGEHDGEVRCETGHVMSVGSLHPDSGERYEVLVDAPVVSAPEYVRKLQAASRAGAPGRTELGAWFDPGGKITAGRHESMLRLLGKKRAEGYDDDAIELYAIETNLERMDPPIEDLDRLIVDVCRYPVGDVDPGVVLGRVTVKDGIAVEAPKPVVDWRLRYVTKDRVRNAPPVTFIIRGFLAVGSITVIAAPVAMRKSLIVANVAHSCLTGENLFEYHEFTVDQKPERVIYLCPEMGLASFSDRIKSLGLVDYVGETFFCQTMNDELTPLKDLHEELPGAVVIIDTMTRFVEGDENKSEDMRKFSASVTRLIQDGAMAVIVLHHSTKYAADKPLTLDNAMRGSTELAAAVTCVWATKLLDADDAYSPSLLKNVKQRDFESKAFEVKSNGPQDCRLRMNAEPGTLTQIKEAKNAEAEEVLKAILGANPSMGVNKIIETLKAAGHGKGAKWIRDAKARINGTGTKVTIGGACA